MSHENKENTRISPAGTAAKSLSKLMQDTVRSNNERLKRLELLKALAAAESAANPTPSSKHSS